MKNVLVLVALLRHHHRRYGTAPDGRLFRGLRGGLLEAAIAKAAQAPRC